MFRSEWASIRIDQLRRLAQSGFGFVRLGVGVEPWMTLPPQQVHLLESRLAHFLDLAQEAGLAVVVTGFALYESKNWSPPQILAASSGGKLEAYAEFITRLAGLLEKRQSDQLALELMNEPQAELRLASPHDWTDIQKQLFRRVREVAPNLIIVLSASDWSSVDGLAMLDMRDYDQRTMVDIHFYEPFAFTHQGADWAEEPIASLAGLSYPCFLTDRSVALEATEARLRARRPTLPPPDFGRALQRARAAIDAHLAEQCDSAAIASRLEMVADWARRQGVAPSRIIIGEFGALKPSPPGMDEGSRVRWIKTVRRESERRGFGWALYVSDSKFGLYRDPQRLELEPEVLRALGLTVRANH